MNNEIDQMLSSYNLKGEGSILDILGDIASDEEIRNYCWKVLNSYSSLKKESWLIGLEGGDYIYSFDGNFIFVTDDIWCFNLVGKPAVLELLAGKIRELQKRDI